MRKQRKQSLQRKGTSEELLRAAGLGALLIGAIIFSGGSPISPYWWRHLQRKSRDQKEERKRQQRIWQALTRLERRGLIKKQPLKQKRGYHLILTGKGKTALRAVKAHSLSLELTDKQWDGKWRMILFDIPEKDSGARKSLRQILLQAGAYPLQKSVFITPVVCGNEIENLAFALGHQKMVLYCEVVNLGRIEDSIRKHFNLPPK